ncbi:MAG: hypothetical protein R3A10_18155 [Caldilineaceae bacterium]
MLYQKQFLERLAATTACESNSWTSSTSTFLAGFVLLIPTSSAASSTTELAELDPGDLARSQVGDPRRMELRLRRRQRARRRSGVVRRQAHDPCLHVVGIVEGTSTFPGIENCWRNLGEEPDLMMAFFRPLRRLALAGW